MWGESVVLRTVVDETLRTITAPEVCLMLDAQKARENVHQEVCSRMLNVAYGYAGYYRGDMFAQQCMAGFGDLARRYAKYSDIALVLYLIMLCKTIMFTMFAPHHFQMMCCLACKGYAPRFGELNRRAMRDKNIHYLHARGLLSSLRCKLNVEEAVAVLADFTRVTHECIDSMIGDYEPRDGLLTREDMHKHLEHVINCFKIDNTLVDPTDLCFRQVSTMGQRFICRCDAQRCRFHGIAAEERKTHSSNGACRAVPCVAVNVSEPSASSTIDVAGRDALSDPTIYAITENKNKTIGSLTTISICDADVCHETTRAYVWLKGAASCGDDDSSTNATIDDAETIMSPFSVSVTSRVDDSDTNKSTGEVSVVSSIDTPSQIIDLTDGSAISANVTPVGSSVPNVDNGEFEGYSDQVVSMKVNERSRTIGADMRLSLGEALDETIIIPDHDIESDAYIIDDRRVDRQMSRYRRCAASSHVDPIVNSDGPTW